LKNIEYVKMGIEHANDVMLIFNYYIENSFAAYPEQKKLEKPLISFGSRNKFIKINNAKL